MSQFDCMRKGGLGNPQMGRQITKGDLLGRYTSTKSKRWFVRDKMDAKVWLFFRKGG